MSALRTSSAVWAVKRALLERLVERRDLGELPGVSLRYSLAERDADRETDDTEAGQADWIALGEASSSLDVTLLGVPVRMTEDGANLTVHISAERELGDADDADAAADRMLCVVFDVLSQNPHVGLDPYSPDSGLGSLVVLPVSWSASSGYIPNRGGTRVGHGTAIALVLEIRSQVNPVP